jgi:D-alanyl-D-alanine dipeptidase
MTLPHGFVYLREVDPSIVAALRYLGPENFTGLPVPGYHANAVIVTAVCAEKLKAVQAAVRADGYALVVYDAYRPQKAVDAFVTWSKDHGELSMAEKYYPKFATTKPVLFELSYISATSNHCRGSTVDLTLVEWDRRNDVVWDRPLTLEHRVLGPSGVPVPYLTDGTVDMGSSFDLLDDASHPDAPLDVIPTQYRQRRDYLRTLMEAHGFVVSSREWWHFWLRDEEPFPRPKDGSPPQPFDFDIVSPPSSTE